MTVLNGNKTSLEVMMGRNKRKGLDLRRIAIGDLAAKAAKKSPNFFLKKSSNLEMRPTQPVK